MLKVKFLSLLIILSITAVSQNYNRPTPSGFPQYEFNKTGVSTEESYYLTAPFLLASGSSLRHLSVMDSDGYISWYADNNAQGVYTNFQYHEDHHLFSFAQTIYQGADMKFYLMDSNFVRVDSLTPTNGIPTDIHEFQIMNNGNYLITGTTNTTEDLTGYTFDGTPGSSNTEVRSFVIQEFDPSGNLVFDWKSIDHIHPSDFIDTYNYNVNDFDYAHGNAVDEDDDGNLLISFRHLDAIYKIDRTTGVPIWILGGTSNQFTFANDTGFSGQHDIRRLPNGNITLFDNANSSPPPRKSRGVEYQLDISTMTCTMVYEYYNSWNSYSRAMGNFQTRNNSERLVGYGNCFRPYPNFIHLDDQDNIISELYYMDSILSYRATVHSFPFEITQPSIDCSGTGTVTLSAPTGYSNYEWSTGETTQSIVVSDTGTYQVWVDHGIGMIGSTPLHLTDLQNPCGNVSISDIWDNKQKEIKQVFDLLGRKVITPELNSIYIVQYEDGTSELKYWTNSNQQNY